MKCYRVRVGEFYVPAGEDFITFSLTDEGEFYCTNRILQRLDKRPKDEWTPNSMEWSANEYYAAYYEWNRAYEALKEHRGESDE